MATLKTYLHSSYDSLPLARLVHSPQNLAQVMLFGVATSRVDLCNQLREHEGTETVGRSLLGVEAVIRDNFPVWRELLKANLVDPQERGLYIATMDSGAVVVRLLPERHYQEIAHAIEDYEGARYVAPLGSKPLARDF